jgi:hypothetical protein
MSSADQRINYAAILNIHSFLFHFRHVCCPPRSALPVLCSLSFRLAPPLLGLEESLKTRYFVVHGFSHPDGPGLEQFWITQPLSPDLLASPNVPAELLVYMPCAGMHFDKRQHALLVLGFALSAQRLAANFEEPLPAPQHSCRFRCVPLLLHDNPSPAEKLINMYACRWRLTSEKLTRRLSHIVALAFADRHHLVCGTARTE